MPLRTTQLVHAMQATVAVAAGRAGPATVVVEAAAATVAAAAAVGAAAMAAGTDCTVWWLDAPGGARPQACTPMHCRGTWGRRGSGRRKACCRLAV